MHFLHFNAMLLSTTLNGAKLPSCCQRKQNIDISKKSSFSPPICSSAPCWDLIIACTQCWICLARAMMATVSPDTVTDQLHYKGPSVPPEHSCHRGYSCQFLCNGWLPNSSMSSESGHFWGSGGLSDDLDWVEECD